MTEVGVWSVLFCYVAAVAMVSLLMIQAMFLAFIAIQAEGKLPACETYLEEEISPANLNWHDQQLKKFFLSVYFPILSPELRIRGHALIKALLTYFRRWPALAYLIIASAAIVFIHMT